MTAKGYRGQDRSNAQWVAELLADGTTEQKQAFDDLAHYLRYHLLNGIRRRSGSVPALVQLDQVELEAITDDIVQDTLIRIYNHLGQFTDSGSFLNFALVVAGRILIDEFRRKQWTTSPFSEPPLHRNDDFQESTGINSIVDPKHTDMVGNAIFRAMEQVVYDAIQSDLSKNQAYAFIAYHFRNLSGDQIAQQMGKKRSAVDQLLYQARNKMRCRLLSQGYDLVNLTKS